MKRPRIQKTATLVASSVNDDTVQAVCAFARARAHKEKPKKKSYILTVFGKSKTITKSEYDYMISIGNSSFVKEIEI